MSISPSPYGLSQVSYKGGKYRGSLSTYYIPSEYPFSFGQGDPVQMGSGGFVASYLNPGPTSLAGSTMTLGTFVSVTYVNLQGQTVIAPYWPASTQTFNDQPAIATVNDLPYVVYKVQCSQTLGLDSSSFATAVGKTYNLLWTAPNANTGQSTVSLLPTGGGFNYSTCQIVGLADPVIGGTNSWYDTYADVLVLINNHAFNAGRPGN